MAMTRGQKSTIETSLTHQALSRHVKLIALAARTVVSEIPKKIDFMLHGLRLAPVLALERDLLHSDQLARVEVEAHEHLAEGTNTEHAAFLPPNGCWWGSHLTSRLP